MKPKNRRPKRKPSFNPSELEIRAACERIREGWSSREQETRSVNRITSWSVPQFFLSQGTLADMPEST